jgi:predicted transglutaminase-like cysteine proteinase
MSGLMNQTLTTRGEAMRISSFGHRCARLRSSSRAGLLAVAIAFGFVGAAAQAKPVGTLPPQTPSLGQTGPAKPTVGWTRFCESTPEECAIDASEQETISLTPRAWQTLLRINRQINSMIEPMSDADHWGVEDRWNFAEDGAGDCEDYQLLKRKLLVAAGFPRRAMRMTVVIDEERQGHAVMMVRTNRGDFILDNKRNAVLPWTETGYTFVKREAASGPAWASLGGATSSPVTTAGR